MVDNSKIINVLFERRFQVRVPTIATYSDDELRVLGLPFRKVNDVKKKTDYGEFTLVQLTVNEMVEIFKDGYPIYIINDSDVNIIYKYIDQHLSNWRYRVSNTLHLPDYPEEDLKALDEFAHEIFDVNRVNISKDIYKDSNRFMGIDFNLMGEDYNPKLNYKEIKRESNLIPSKSNKFKLEDLI